MLFLLGTNIQIFKIVSFFMIFKNCGFFEFQPMRFFFCIFLIQVLRFEKYEMGQDPKFQDLSSSDLHLHNYCFYYCIAFVLVHTQRFFKSINSNFNFFSPRSYIHHAHPIHSMPSPESRLAEGAPPVQKRDDFLGRKFFDATSFFVVF